MVRTGKGWCWEGSRWEHHSDEELEVVAVLVGAEVGPHEEEEKARRGGEVRRSGTCRGAQ